MRKFLIDQNIPKGFSDWLGREGHNVKLVKNIDPEMSDRDAVSHASGDGRILVTNDSDFIGLCMDNKEANVIVFRQKSQSAYSRIFAMKKILPELEKTMAIGLIIIE